MIKKQILEQLESRTVSIITLVNLIIEHANFLRASDIHIDPFEYNLVIRFRIDGLLGEKLSLPKNLQEEIISRIKILSGLRTDEHRRPQDGRFRIIIDSSPLDIRVSIVPTFYGENCVLRLLSQNINCESLDDLNLSAQNKEKILTAISKPSGMILVTGPTGSGKTTTLYTILKLLNRPELNLITIEDPVEYAISGIKQIPVRGGHGLTFASGLRSILRQDPDVVMVGEIRDSETAGIAINTALTGHLLLSTLHTNDPASTLPRLLDMGIEPYLVAATVNLIIGQRLVRKICEACKKVGCEFCGLTGYKGRVALHEIIVVDEIIRKAILAKSSAVVIRELSVSRGTKALFDDGQEKASAGLTTIEEVLRINYE